MVTATRVAAIPATAGPPPPGYCRAKIEELRIAALCIPGGGCQQGGADWGLGPCRVPCRWADGLPKEVEALLRQGELPIGAAKGAGD